jgi:hypothetical protein
MIYKEPSPKAGAVRVTFEMPASVWASQVYLVGEFNNWNPCASPFQRLHNGVWSITLDLPARRRYEFRYLIDGHWCTDYHADSCTENNFHALNSIVETTLPLETFTMGTSPSMVREAAFGSGRDAAAYHELNACRPRTN